MGWTHSGGSCIAGRRWSRDESPVVAVTHLNSFPVRYIKHSECPPCGRCSVPAIPREFIAALKQPGAEINQANADIQEQNNRISADQTTQQNNEFGGGCNAGDYNNYSSCLSQEEQAAANASSDETAARAAAKNDENQLGAAYQQSEGAISTFVAQVDSIPWPTRSLAGVLHSWNKAGPITVESWGKLPTTS